jgi:hypothetical protein
MRGTPVSGGTVISVLSENATFRHWELGFEQSGSYLAVRALRSEPTLHTFRRPPLSRYAIFPSGFRLRVDQVAQRYPSQPFPPVAGITQAAYAAQSHPKAVTGILPYELRSRRYYPASPRPKRRPARTPSSRAVGNAPDSLFLRGSLATRT